MLHSKINSFLQKQKKNEPEVSTSILLWVVLDLISCREISWRERLLVAMKLLNSLVFAVLGLPHRKRLRYFLGDGGQRDRGGREITASEIIQVHISTGESSMLMLLSLVRAFCMCRGEPCGSILHPAAQPQGRDSNLKSAPDADCTWNSGIVGCRK